MEFSFSRSRPLIFLIFKRSDFCRTAVIIQDSQGFPFNNPSSIKCLDTKAFFVHTDMKVIGLETGAINSKFNKEPKQRIYTEDETKHLFKSWDEYVRTNYKLYSLTCSLVSPNSSPGKLCV